MHFFSESKATHLLLAVMHLRLVSVFAAVLLGCHQVSGSDETVHFDYGEGEHGPAHWNELRPEWAVCKTGLQQSPIHITPDNMLTDDHLRKSTSLKAHYRKKTTPGHGGATIGHDGHSVVVSVPPSSGKLSIDGVLFRPAQLHFHLPSEHKIMNTSFPLEMHLVHYSDDNKIAVIGFLFLEGEESEFLAQFTDKLPSYKEAAHVKRDIGSIDLMAVEHRNYGRYMGSLTTPPCSENVTWTIMLWNFPTVSSEQLRSLRDSMLHTNNRPTFSSKGRHFHTSF